MSVWLFHFAVEMNLPRRKKRAPSDNSVSLIRKDVQKVSVTWFDESSFPEGSHVHFQRNGVVFEGTGTVDKAKNIQ